MDGRARIRRGIDLVGAMAIPAAGCFDIAAQRAKLRVEGIAVGRKLVLVARTANRSGLHAKRGFGRLQNRVGGVAVRAHRGLQIPRCDRMPVRPTPIIRIDLCVARSTGVRDIRLECRALRVIAAQNVMRSVAIWQLAATSRSFLAQGKPVDRVHVVWIDAGEAMFLGHAIIAVAGPAGLGNIERIYGRPRVALGIDLVRVSMAACAGMIFRRGVDTPLQRRRLSAWHVLHSTLAMWSGCG